MRILAAGDEFVGTTLLTDAVRAHVADAEFSELSLPWPVEPFGPVGGVQEASGTEDQVIEALGDAEVAVTQMAPFTKKVFAAAPDLRLVSVCRGGPVNVDLTAATEAGVAVTFAPGRNAAAAAEFAIGLILAAMRRIPTASAELLGGQWRGDYYAYPNAGLELDGTTVGLVGYGAIGARVAKVLVAFGSRVLVADPYADADRVAADGANLVELDELLRSSPVVSLHARLTEQTHHLIDAEKLALLPEGAVLVNSARGGLLDYAPLPDLLRSGKLGALALDVYDEEPPPADWELRSLPNVIATPHLAGCSKQTAQRAAEIVAAEVGRYARGETLLNVANPDVLR
ncbi:2-hydroxyacid dehydrogenase [Prauserella rugosa]|uniref:D-3-phosphoglycerate dehydrogenase n=1 Tax=Prauserella rugosa TaxID=43354 RepID=A0A660CEE4_9PSEU|nr:2-hydroxyacid dehydrogenase [Prauserella rugosa]KMS82858.1 2-hydroxyacid dehydrogenase [Streptomyces regensis]TWH19321.1 D-3-phosphoglycerate dehydrogenase [Prauserella rugosa]